MLEMRAAGAKHSDIASSVGRNLRSVWEILHSRGDKRLSRHGLRHPLWKGGKYKTSSGYFTVWLAHDDKLALMRDNHGRVVEHRLVLARSLGRPLNRHETVHHINGDRTDNRLENLQLRQGKHGASVVMYCGQCGSIDIRHGKLA